MHDTQIVEGDKLLISASFGTIRTQTVVELTCL